MSQPQSIEEIMQRLRAQIGKPEASGNAKPTPQNTAVLSGSNQSQIFAPTKNAGPAGPHPRTDSMPPLSAGADAPVVWHPKFHELSQLRIETQTALDGSRQTGQLNPRNPGLLNSAIQFLKKVMRRSLTWYTRPLHHFQGGVIRALQQIVAILDNYRDTIQKLADRYNLQVEAAQRSQSEIASQLGTHATRLEEHGSTLQGLNSKFSSQSLQVQQLSNHVDTQLGEIRAAMSATGQQSTAQFDELRALFHGQRSELDARRDELHKLLSHLHELKVAQRVRERDLRRLLHTVQQSGVKASPSVPPPVPAMFPSEIKDEFAFDYFAFEELYRGDESDIQQRQKAYLDYFRGRTDVLDIGCGRGEFLELLRENGVSARGVELGTDQYLLCKEKGLDVVQGDLFEVLESLPDGSLGGIFSAQVIEHMTASDQLRYLALAYQKTRPGSPVLFETINPECVYAFVHNFFLDPTHVRPVHPETLRFAMESSGFSNVEVRYSGPASDKQIPPLHLDGDPASLAQFNAAISGLNNLLFGYQDYAAIGWR